MRRDFAEYRERTGLQKQPQANGSAAEVEGPNEQEGNQEPEAIEPEPEDVTAVKDVSMEDLQVDSTEHAQDETAEVQGEIEKSKTEDIITNDKELEIATADSNNLHIDTHTEPKEAKEDTDELPPDTGTLTNDLDSLFGGPLSAGGTATDGGQEFNLDSAIADGNAENNATGIGDDDFDFSAFDDGNNMDIDVNNAAVDNDDNIASLLPGLQDYANSGSQPGGGTGDAAFDALFSSAADLNTGGEDGQGNTQHRDSTFDDLLDFANFNGDFTAGNEGEGGDTEDFDFDFK